jgi:hypothetical protein
MAEHDRQGTGKHGHKDTQEPYPHHQDGQGGSQQGQGQGGSQQGRGQGGQDEQESLKEREYRDEKGDVHHHTKTYMEQHGKDQGGSGRS